MWVPCGIGAHRINPICTKNVHGGNNIRVKLVPPFICTLKREWELMSSWLWCWWRPYCYAWLSAMACHCWWWRWWQSYCSMCPLCQSSRWQRRWRWQSNKWIGRDEDRGIGDGEAPWKLGDGEGVTNLTLGSHEEERRGSSFGPRRNIRRVPTSPPPQSKDQEGLPKVDFHAQVRAKIK